MQQASPFAALNVTCAPFSGVSAGQKVKKPQAEWQKVREE